MGETISLTPSFSVRVPLEVELKLKKPMAPGDLNLQKLSTVIQLAVLEIVSDLLDEENPSQTVTYESESGEEDSRLEELREQLSKLIGTEVRSFTFRAV